MAELITIAVSYLVLACTLIALLLFGESPLFQGTPVAWGHWLITDGFWSGAEWLLVRVCGKRMQLWIETILECCCDRPNHVLQVSYVMLLIVGYWMYWNNIFVMLPNKWVGDIHIITGTISMVICCVTFVMACRSDPGAVTVSTLEAHRAMYPCDTILWDEKTCVTCKWARPARSKHCRVCGRCVARHDHHCGWINNCVGLLNHRIFLLFLVSNLVMTVYGSVLGALTLLGQADRAGMLRHRFLDYRTGGVKVIWLPASRVFEWLVVMLPVSVALTLFMTAAALLVILFLSYQLFLICQGKTQYEVHRWRIVRMALDHLAKAENPGPTQGHEGAVSDANITGTHGATINETTGVSRRATPAAETASKATARASSGRKGSTSAVSSGDSNKGPEMGAGGGMGQSGGAAISAGAGGRGGRKRGIAGHCLVWFGRKVGWLPPAPRRGKAKIPRNVYNRGAWGNFSEILFPYHHLQKHGKRT